MQDKPHRRLNLTQPYSQTNGSTLTVPENGHGNGVEHSHPEEPATPTSVASAVQPLMQSAGGRPAYLVVPLDSAGDALKTAFGETTATTPPPPAAAVAAPASRSWLLPALGGAVLGAVAVGALVFQFITPRAATGKKPTVPVAAAKPAKKAAPVAVADVNGVLLLRGGRATVHGKKIRQENDAIGYWDGSDAYVSWVAEVPKAGTYRVELSHAVGKNSGGPFVVQAGQSRITSRSKSTGGWDINRTVTLGNVTLPKGRSNVAVRPNGKLTAPLMVLRAVRLTPTAAK